MPNTHGPATSIFGSCVLVRYFSFKTSIGNTLTDLKLGFNFPDTLPVDYSYDSSLVTADSSDGTIKLLGYYGYFQGGDNVGNVGTAKPLFIGAANDQMFSAPRLDVSFLTIEGDVSAAVRITKCAIL